MKICDICVAYGNIAKKAQEVDQLQIRAALPYRSSYRLLSTSHTQACQFPSKHHLPQASEAFMNLDSRRICSLGIFHS
jgi:hypothetical protein